MAYGGATNISIPSFSEMVTEICVFHSLPTIKCDQPKTWNYPRYILMANGDVTQTKIVVISNELP